MLILYNSLIFHSNKFQPYSKKTDFEELVGLTIAKTIEICGFLNVTDVGSPSAISRHLVLPLPTERSTSMQGISLEDESDNEDPGDDGKVPSFCVLLHGALKVFVKSFILFNIGDM